MSHKLVKLAAVAAFSMLTAGSAVQAAILPPGSVQIPASAELNPVGGAVIASLSSNFVIPGSSSGVLRTLVISGDTSNPFGGLTFAYMLFNDGVAGPTSIGRLTTIDFTGFLTDASYDPQSGGVAPATVDRNASGDVIGFNFVPTPIDPMTGFLSPGLTSTLLVVQTNAQSYTESTAFVIDGGVTATATLGPVVPEPGIGLGAAALGLLLSRRRRA